MNIPNHIAHRINQHGKEYVGRAAFQALSIENSFNKN